MIHSCQRSRSLVILYIRLFDEKDRLAGDTLHARFDACSHRGSCSSLNLKQLPYTTGDSPYRHHEMKFVIAIFSPIRGWYTVKYQNKTVGNPFTSLYIQCLAVSFEAPYGDTGVVDEFHICRRLPNELVTAR